MAPQTLTKLNVSGLCHLAQIGLVAVLLVAVAPQVAAQAAPPPPCNERGKFAAFLLERYDEVPVEGGPTLGGGLLELFKSSPDSPKDTWTLVRHFRSGVSCLVAAGEGWRSFPDKVPSDGGI